MSVLSTQPSSVRIAWVDDHAQRSDSVRAALVDSFDVVLVGDADAALTQLPHHPPAVVCVAASLLTAQGAPLLPALRASPKLRRAVLVLVCARGEESSLAEELLASADDLLLTPLSATELSARLRAHVSRTSSSVRAQDPTDLAFLSGLGHELRTPLTAILLWASSLRGGAKSGPELERALRCIAASAQAQARRIDDLLDLSRLAEGRLELDRRITDMSALVRSAWDELWPLATAKHIALALEVTEPLGEAEVDANRVHQVLFNLLSNAVKFTSEGGEVRLRARGHEQAIEIEVSDTGEGIAPALMPRLFERFQFGSSGVERRHPGLGIGLALSRQLVALHGGKLEAHSAGSDRGATFRVSLPVPRVEEAAGTGARAGRVATRHPLRGRTILLVEDHEETREAMQFVLERAGARVLSAESGSGALDVLGVAPDPSSNRDTAKLELVDVIVCDLGLPDMSGYEFISHVVQTYQRQGRCLPPACAISAHARDVDRRRAIEAGFDLHLAKPVTAKGLIESVEDLCQLAKPESADNATSTLTA